MWYRVFGLNDVIPEPAELQSRFGWGEIAVRGDDLGWTSLKTGPLLIERYLAEGDDLRDDLDTWAAWVEQQQQHPLQLKLMQHLISTRQLLTFQTESETSGWQIARRFALLTDGVYQVDGRGFFAADGALMVDET
jgi:hypothetical protein